MKKYYNQGDLYKEACNWGFAYISEGESMAIMSAAEKQSWCWSRSWELTSWSKSTNWNSMGFRNLKTQPQWYTSYSKTSLLILTKQPHQPRTKHSKTEDYGAIHIQITIKKPKIYVEQQKAPIAKATLSEKTIPKFAIPNFKVYCGVRVIKQPYGSGTSADM